jgi:hypothetical protein
VLKDMESLETEENQGYGVFYVQVVVQTGW